MLLSASSSVSVVALDAFVVAGSGVVESDVVVLLGCVVLRDPRGDETR